LIEVNIAKLKDIKELLVTLPISLYTEKKEILSGSSIGQHFRHVLEFYVCAFSNLDSNVISYDKRERNLLIETDTNTASNVISSIVASLESVTEDQSVSLEVNYSGEIDSECVKVPSTLYRELAYCLEHTIHHLIIIKLALKADDDEVELSDNFGVAPSTIRHRKKCAQ